MTKRAAKATVAYQEAYKALHGVEIQVVWRNGWCYVGYNPKGTRLKDLVNGTRELKMELKMELRDRRREAMTDKPHQQDNMILVNVRWCDGYLEVFECSQVRLGGQILWMRQPNGQNRTIPLVGVRWFSTEPESHAISKEDAVKPV
jgi:hypothetical protein